MTVIPGLIIITAFCIIPFLSSTLHSYSPSGSRAVGDILFRRTCWVEPVLVKRESPGLPLRGTMVPSGKCHSPTLPPSLVLQHWVLMLVVAHTRVPPGWSGPVPPGVPISVMSTELPGRYVVPLNMKYSPSIQVVAYDIVKEYELSLKEAYLVTYYNYLRRYDTELAATTWYTLQYIYSGTSKCIDTYGTWRKYVS